MAGGDFVTFPRRRQHVGRAYRRLIAYLRTLFAAARCDVAWRHEAPLASPRIRLLLGPARGPGDVDSIAQNFRFCVSVAFTKNIQIRQIWIGASNTGIGLQTAGIMRLGIRNFQDHKHGATNLLPILRGQLLARFFVPALIFIMRLVNYSV